MLLGSAIVSAWVLDKGGGALAGMEDWTRLCADKDGEANMCRGKWTGDDDTTRRLTYKTHTSSVGSYRSQTTCLSDHSTGTPYSTCYYAVTCLSRVVE